MLGWVGDVERATVENETFRTVVYTGEHVQLTVMRLGPGEDIGRETHPHLDQFLRIESGAGRVEFGQSETAIDETYDVHDTGRSSCRPVFGTTSSTSATAI